MAMDAMTLLTQQCDDEIAHLTRHIAEGKCATFDEYKYMSGRINGLTVARANIQALKQQLEQDDDE